MNDDGLDGEPLPTIPKFQEGVLTHHLPRCTECTNLPSMRWMCAQLRTFLLLAVALMVAAHPLARSRSTSHLLVNEFGPKVQVVICTSHGPVVLEDPTGMPRVINEDASCPWCAVEGGLAGKHLASAGVQIGDLARTTPALAARLRGRPIRIATDFCEGSDRS